MRQFWIKVLQRVVPYTGFVIGIIFAEWLWKHFVGR
jgi:hypothetical protein